MNKIRLNPEIRTFGYLSIRKVKHSGETKNTPFAFLNSQEEGKRKKN
jgi:hypothetical protein